MRRAAALAVAALALAAPAADARQSPKKSVLVPVGIDGVSVFPTLQDLGVGTYHFVLSWRQTAPERPRRPADPDDVAYEWPDELDFALAEASRRGMRVAVTVQATPPWANGVRTPADAPAKAGRLADFLTAASRRYPGVRIWKLFEDANSAYGYAPLGPQDHPGAPLTSVQRGQLAHLAALTDAAYVAIKRADRRDVLVGGSISSTGDISPRAFLSGFALPDGRPPRMDWFAFNPVGARRPVPGAQPAPPPWTADLASLGRLEAWVDRAIPPRRGRRVRLFLGRWGVPSDHPSRVFGGELHVTREEQAAWVADALAVARRNRRVAVLGLPQLRDEPPASDGLESTAGLLDPSGVPKPAYAAFRDG